MDAPRDLLSQAINGLTTAEAAAISFEAAGDWAVAFSPPEGVKFNVVMRGRAWVWTAASAPQVVAEGDGFMLTRGVAFRLASDPALRAIDPAEHYCGSPDGVARMNGGGEFVLLGGRFRYAQDRARFLFSQLPELIVVRKVSPPADYLPFALEALVAENGGALPGRGAMNELLGLLLLVQFLRAHLDSAPAGGTGWIYALRNPRIRPALDAIHHETGRRWSIGELAGRCGMSRSAFAAEFAAAVGRPPGRYLAAWRMMIACERLREPGSRALDIALDLGFESESAFSNAFKRQIGMAPRHWARQSARGVDAGARRAPEKASLSTA